MRDPLGAVIAHAEYELDDRSSAMKAHGLTDSDGIAELPFYHGEGRFDVRPAMVVFHVLFLFEMEVVECLLESAALSAFVGDPMNKGLGVGINFFPSQNNICTPATYVKPKVEIAALPGSAMALDAAIMGQTPGGNTPTEPSLDGALQHAMAWAKANPTHKVAVVYSTDGYPKGCDANNTQPNLLR